MTLSELVDHARAALEDELTPEQAALRIAEYTERFEKVLGANPEIVRDPASAVLLKELGDLHPRVLARAEELRDSVGETLKRLKRYGKGVMAYADQLPKRVSFERTRKG